MREVGGGNMDCHISHSILLHFTQTSEIVRGVTVVALVTRFIAAKRGEGDISETFFAPSSSYCMEMYWTVCLHCLSFICILFDCFVIFCIYAVNQRFEFSLKWTRYKTVANRLNAKPSKKRKKRPLVLFVQKRASQWEELSWRFLSTIHPHSGHATRTCFVSSPSPLSSPSPNLSIKTHPFTIKQHNSQSNRVDSLQKSVQNAPRIVVHSCLNCLAPLLIFCSRFAAGAKIGHLRYLPKKTCSRMHPRRLQACCNPLNCTGRLPPHPQPDPSQRCMSTRESQ